MKLDTFIANVLQDIEAGLRAAGQSTRKAYWITSNSGNAGVSFDIAVTAKDASSTQAGGTAEGAVKGGLKLGVVEVVTANVGGNVDTRVEQKTENSEVSHIQFTVYVPVKTNAEEQQNHREFAANQHAMLEDDPW